MVEYRHNKDWGTMFFPRCSPENIKYEIEIEAENDDLGDIEVIDIQITSFSPYEGVNYASHNALVIYRQIPKEVQEIKSEVIVK